MYVSGVWLVWASIWAVGDLTQANLRICARSQELRELAQRTHVTLGAILRYHQDR